MKYKLNTKQDIDRDEDGTYFLWLQKGWRFSDDPLLPVHCRGYDTMKELKQSIKLEIEPCNCKSCLVV